MADHDVKAKDEKKKDDEKDEKDDAAAPKPQPYPAWRFKAKPDPPEAIPEYDSVLVNSEEEDKKLGKGWVDSPAKLAKPKAKDDDDKPEPVAHQEHKAAVAAPAKK